MLMLKAACLTPYFPPTAPPVGGEGLDAIRTRSLANIGWVPLLPAGASWQDTLRWPVTRPLVIKANSVHKLNRGSFPQFLFD